MAKQLTRRDLGRAAIAGTTLAHGAPAAGAVSPWDGSTEEPHIPTAVYRRAVIRIGAQAGTVERNVAKLLAERVGEPSGIAVRIEEENAAAPSNGELVILLGIPEHHSGLASWFQAQRLPPLSGLEPGPEGFLLQTVSGKNAVLLAAGIDDRGVLYAAGEILRRMEIGTASFEFPAEIKVRTAPAFEVRGTQFGQSSVARTKGRVRPWTDDEQRRAIVDYALAGLNTVAASTSTRNEDVLIRVAREFGLKVLIHYGPNTCDGTAAIQAMESIGRNNYLCPSAPEGRKALLERCEKEFRDAPKADYVRFPGGDGGGCECDMCKPYGGTFIRLCEELAAIIRRYHPRAEFFAINQKFDNADDEAIFAYLQEKPRPWLRAFSYGPGSDAMGWQPGHRQTHRMDLFRYPGFGPFDRYLKEILHQLPPQQDIVFYNELTHWRYSQNGLAQAYPRADRNGDRPPHWNHFIYERQPDRALTMVYDRLSFFAWPRYYHWVFNETMRYGIGDVTHSSGTQDHFNQWMWQRLMWAPQTRVEDVVAEYARTWFGPAAAPRMAQAIFQLEDNVVEKPGVPITKKEGIDRYYRLVSEAGKQMPAVRMKHNWLWREYMEKAALDKHIQLSVRQQIEVRERIVAAARRNPETALEQGAAWIDGIRPTPEMTRLREEAGRLGDESNRLFGVRSEGYYNLEHDFIGLGWLKRQLGRVRSARGAERTGLLRMITDYENPGEGGFYDNCGTLDGCPNVVHGYPFDFGQPVVAGMLSEGNLPSQKTMHYTQDEEHGVAFRYRGLDPRASYRIRFTLVRPWYQERYNARMHQRTETIYAGDVVLARDLEVPERMSDHFTFDIPAEAIRGGELTIRFERSPDEVLWPAAERQASGNAMFTKRIQREVWRNCGGWGTIVAEAWLMKRG